MVNHKFPSIIVALLLHFIGFSQRTNSNNGDKCSIRLVFVDSESYQPVLGQIAIYSTAELIQSVFDGKLILPCRAYDSIYVRPVGLGYEDTVLVLNSRMDTIFLESNSYTFDEIEIVANKRRDKKYRLGKKNKKCRNFHSFQAMDLVEDLGDDVFNSKLVSLVINNVGKRLKINEISIFIKGIPIDSIPNLHMSIYKNNKGELGKRIHEKLMFDRMNKSEGWAKVVFSESINLPTDGFFVVLEKADITSYSPSVGLISVRLGEIASAYSFVNRVDDGAIYSNMTLKIFIKAKG